MKKIDYYAVMVGLLSAFPLLAEERAPGVEMLPFWHTGNSTKTLATPPAIAPVAPLALSPGPLGLAA